MTRVAFRLDASRTIGTGHWRRCAALADALGHEGAQTLFVSRQHDGVSSAMSSGEPDCVWLDAPSESFAPAAGEPAHAQWAGVGWEQDARESARLLADFAPSWIVVDHYAFDARWHRLVADLTGAKLVVIDDLADRSLEATWLVDQNLHADHRAKYAGRISAGTRLLGGPRYALLADVYASAQPHVFRETARSIGIFMGGTDPDDLTSQAMTACRDDAGFRGRIEVVSSRLSVHHAGRLALAGRWPDTHVFSDLADLCAFFQRHDLQVGAGGGAAWERCCMAAPAVAWAIAANQEAVLPQLHALGALHWAQPQAGPVRSIGQAVRALLDDPPRRKAMGQMARTIVDGRGSQRVAAALVMTPGHAPGLREAQPHDSRVLLAWANEPEVRQQSFNSGTITDEEHAAWFSAKLADSHNAAIYMAVSPAGTPIGQVRFDRTGEGWQISYLLDPAFRGMSMAQPMLRAAIDKLGLRHGPGSILAWVKLGNEASARSFRALGFVQSQMDRSGQACYFFRLDP